MPSNADYVKTQRMTIAIDTPAKSLKDRLLDFFNRHHMHWADRADASLLVEVMRTLSGTPTPPNNMFALDFHRVGTYPEHPEPGKLALRDYVLYNQCDGFHLVIAFWDEAGFVNFRPFASDSDYEEDMYVAWAEMPDTGPLFERFARKTEGASA